MKKILFAVSVISTFSVPVTCNAQLNTDPGTRQKIQRMKENPTYKDQPPVDVAVKNRPCILTSDCVNGLWSRIGK